MSAPVSDAARLLCGTPNHTDHAEHCRMPDCRRCKAIDDALTAAEAKGRAEAASMDANWLLMQLTEAKQRFRADMAREIAKEIRMELPTVWKWDRSVEALVRILHDLASRIEVKR